MLRRGLRALALMGVVSLCSLAVGACGDADRGAAAPRLYAASSLIGPVEALPSSTVGDLTPVFGATSLLVQQVRAGAEPGVLIAADAAWADALEADGLTEPGSRVDLLFGDLVLIAPAGAAPDISQLADLARPGTGRVALAETLHVPLGRYSRAALTAAGIWDDVRPRVVEVTDARAVVALVARGEVDLGIAYASDAASSAIDRVLDVPRDLYPRVVYPMLLLRGAPPPARELWERLQSVDAAAIFENAGFETVRR